MADRRQRSQSTRPRYNPNPKTASASVGVGLSVLTADILVSANVKVFIILIESRMILKTFTLAHVVISLVGILAGLVVLAGMLTANPMEGWTAIFMCATVATSVTGFFFPYKGFKPSYVVGALSLILLTLAYMGRYSHHLLGSWRWIYVVTAVASLYLNVFVLVVQSFQKVPALNALAPTQTEPPFKRTQVVVLVAFVLLGGLAIKNFHVEPIAIALGR